MTYYTRQLSRIKDSIEYHKKIVVHDHEGNSTHYMGLSEESIPIFIEYLQNELARLRKTKIRS